MRDQSPLAVEAQFADGEFDREQVPIGMPGGFHPRLADHLPLPRLEVAREVLAVVGRMVYDRTHNRDLGSLPAFGLSRRIPFAAVVFILSAVAGMGLPGFSGFIAELQVLIGSWNAYPTLTVVAGAGIVVAVAYSLRAIQKGFFGDSTDVATDVEMDPITLPERVGGALLLLATLGVGLYPDVLLRWIMPALNGGCFDVLLKGGGP